MKTVIIFIALVVFSCMIQHGEGAAITAWSEPVGTAADISAAAATKIAESVANGASTGVTIQATSTGTESYEITSQPTAGKLTIDSASGLLTLAVGTFDFETEPTYVLVIVATSGTDKGTATVTLSITDVNEAPAFATAQYAATVPDASTEGTAVTTVTATEQDAGDSATYTITSGNTNTDFAIDGTTGAITVATGQTLAAGTLAGYTLVITATDGSSVTDTQTVWIAVTDCSGASVVVASLLSLFVAFSVVLY